MAGSRSLVNVRTAPASTVPLTDTAARRLEGESATAPGGADVAAGAVRSRVQPHPRGRPRGGSRGAPRQQEGLTAAIVESGPEVIIHELTAIPGSLNLRKLDEAFAPTNRLRTEVTDTQLAAARRAGTRRFIAQSFGGWPYAREGRPVKTEEDRLDPSPPAAFRETLGAIRYLEDVLDGAADLEALALRYGFFYGPGTSIAQDGAIVEALRRRRLPIVGDGGGIWSFVHIDDAARATVAAISRGDPGIYNVADDEPAPVSAWLPALARAVGARRPFRIPVWLGRRALGEGGVSTMTQNRGASNAKAKRELGWEPAYASWRRGFAEGLG
ncbi:MAG: NAD-dependent epimerase/dehydratase family protein [Gemmatimonadota bacterium]